MGSLQSGNLFWLLKLWSNIYNSYDNARADFCIYFRKHIQRENKMLSGAGADRMQTGMQLSFGKTIAKAAILRNNEGIMSVAVANPKMVSFVRGIMKQIKAKLPCKTKIVYELKSN